MLSDAIGDPEDFSHLAISRDERGAVTRSENTIYPIQLTVTDC